MITSLNFLQNAPSNSVIFSTEFTCTASSKLSRRVKISESIGNIQNYLCNRSTSTKYDYSKIVCFRCLPFNIVNYKPLCTMLNYVCKFFKIWVFSTHFISATKPVTPIFWGISDTSNSLSDCSKSSKKSVNWNNLAPQAAQTYC